MKPKAVQLPLELTDHVVSQNGNGDKNSSANRLDPQDRAFHDWYRFVLSFPPHVVRHYLRDFNLDSDHVVLDPFCGTGTTLVEAKLNGVKTIGTEANRFAHFASSVKTDWEVDPETLSQQSQRVAGIALDVLRKQGIDDYQTFRGKTSNKWLRKLSEEQDRLVLSDSISPVPLHKTLVLLDCLREYRNEGCYRHQLLALANALVFSISNLHFGPEVGVGKPKADTPVIASWLCEINKMAGDLRLAAGKAHSHSQVYLADARKLDEVLQPNSIDAVITSPPYPNEKDYTRTTRLESVILGFISSKDDLRQLKQGLMRSNTRNVYKGDDDDGWVAEHPKIQRIADEIERRRIELG